MLGGGGGPNSLLNAKYIQQLFSEIGVLSGRGGPAAPLVAFEQAMPSPGRALRSDQQEERGQGPEPASHVGVAE